LAKLSERVQLSLGSANSFCVTMCMRTFGSDLLLGWNNLWIEWVGKPSQRDFAICHNKNRNPPQPFFYSHFSLCLSPSLIWNFCSGRRKQAERASIVSLILVSVFVFDVFVFCFWPLRGLELEWFGEISSFGLCGG
jgi:hypothetical protein